MNNITLTPEKINQYQKIFNGSENNRGRYSEKLKSLVTMPEPFNFEEHLSGKNDQGLSPVKFIEGKAFAQYFGCDLDFGYQNIQTQKDVVEAANKFDKNLFVFKSKSKGYHVIGFEDNLIEADTLKKKAKRLEKYLQKKFDTDKKIVDTGKTIPQSWNEKELKSGAWLRTPYFKTTERKAISKDGFKELSFNRFLTMLKYKKHTFLSAISGCDKGENTHHKLFWAAGYIKHYLNDDKRVYEEIYKSIGYNEYDENQSGQNILHQWKCREKYKKEYFDNGIKGILKKEFNITNRTTEEELPDLSVRIFNSNIEIKKREWAMEKYLQKGKLTLIQGMGGAGKSTLLCQIATCFTTGQDFFGNQMKMTGNALVIFAEEDQNEIDLRLKACETIIGKSDQNKIHTIGYDQNLKLVKFKYSGETEKTKQYEQLNDYIKDNDIKLICLDPLISLQLGSFDENSNPQMDSFIKNYLIPLAANNDACLVAAHHTNKISMLTESETSDNSLYSGRGASSLGAAARIVVGVALMSKKLWEDEYKSILPDERDRFNYIALVDAKNNYAARNEIPTWIKKKQIQIDCQNGVEWVNVFETCNLSELSNKKSELRAEHDKKKILDVIHIISDFFTEEQNHVVSVNSLASKLTSQDTRLATSKEATLKQEWSRLIKGVFVRPVEYKGFKFKYSYDSHMKNKHNLTKLNADFKDPF